jgi:hypothetical protein
MFKEEQNCGINWKRVVEKLLLHKLISDYNKGLCVGQGRLILFLVGPKKFQEIKNNAKWSL